MNTTCVTTAIAALFAGMLSLGPAWAANEGKALGVDPDALARGSSGDRTLIVGADVSVGERVVTGASGQVQLVFLDDTRLVVGPGSSLLIETYLMRGGGSAERFAINALGGTFRFISGNSPKSAYEIRTPSATIGVRGTKFDVVVGRAETRVMLYEGAVRVCTGSGCVDLDERCGIASAAGSARLFTPADPQRPQLAQAFRYAIVQSPLLRPFRVSGANRCTESSAAPATESSGEPGDSYTPPSPNSGGNPAPSNPPPSTPPPTGGNANNPNQPSQPGSTPPTVP
ncbi:FecR family protein [Devosia geojensis]|uniref:FecR family protein n=1 Tax=Devosia geojensis TaxID=443610 RepID=UPI0006973608|nr:FecR domain-containing protein [Devosia geojensis]